MKRVIALPVLLALVITVAVGTVFTGPAAPTVQGETDVALELTGIPGDTVLLRFDGVAVTARKFLYLLWSGTDEFYQAVQSYGMGEVDLNEEMTAGQTWGGWLKEVARQRAAALAMADQMAQRYGVTLSDEDLQELSDLRESNIEALGGPEAYARQLLAFGIDDQSLFEIQRDATLMNKVESVASQVDQTCTPEEAEQYIRENDLLRAKHILLSTQDEATGEPLDQEAKAAKAAEAEDILDRLRADPDQFDALMSEYSQDPGLVTNPEGYLFTAGEMVSVFEEATRALEPGQISDVVESDFGYHIILRLDADCDQVRQAVIQQRQSAAAAEFSTQVEQAIANAQTETHPDYDAIDAGAYYQALLAYQKTLEPAAGGDGDAVIEDQRGAELEPGG